MSLKMKIINIVTSIMLLNAFLSSIVHGQSTKHLPTINKEILYKEIDSLSSQYKYFVVVIFTNYCSGTQYINLKLKRIDSITNHQSYFFLCQSSNGKDRGDMQKIIDLYQFNGENVYLIDENLYKTKFDHRRQGMLFRNDICDLCIHTTIGVPFYIVLDREKNPLLHFYPTGSWEKVLAAIIQ